MVTLQRICDFRSEPSCLNIVDMKILAFLLSAVIIVGLAGSASAGAWFKAENMDCMLWNPEPDEDQKVRWRGECKDGKAYGDGVAEWYSYQRPPDLCECSLVDGKAEDMGIFRWYIRRDGDFSLVHGKNPHVPRKNPHVPRKSPHVPTKNPHVPMKNPHVL